MVQIWGHRGCRGAGNPPENSLAAFKAAVAQGADGIELDVFLTKDNHLVVFHDDTLERMTDYSGEDKFTRHITDFTRAELKALRLRQANGDMAADIGIPTLDEVMDALPKKSFMVNIEIKEDKKGRHIAQEVAGAVERYWQNGWERDSIIVSAFDKQSVLAMKNANPAIQRAALLAGAVAPWNITEATLKKELAEIRRLGLEPKSVNITLPSMSHKAARMIRAEGYAPVAWTSRERNPHSLSGAERRALATKLQANGIDALITDYPEQMKWTLANYRKSDLSRNS
jgi:glycerophosphoryl diester phosphodiesterase